MAGVTRCLRGALSAGMQVEYDAACALSGHGLAQGWEGVGWRGSRLEAITYYDDFERAVEVVASDAWGVRGGDGVDVTDALSSLGLWAK